MFKQIKEFFFGKPVEVTKKEDTKTEAVNTAPYKVEATVTTEVASVEVAPGLAEIVGTNKVPVKKQQFIKKPAAATSPVKTKAPAKPRAPRKPAAK